MVLMNQLIYLVNVKTKRKIFSNYVCFSKSPNLFKLSSYRRFKKEALNSNLFGEDSFLTKLAFTCSLFEQKAEFVR